MYGLSPLANRLGRPGCVGGAGGGFSPSDIAGLELWLDASDSSTLWQDTAGTTPAGDTDPVGRWDDKSGNGRHATQGNANHKPALQAASLNGMGGLDFDGSDDYLTTAAYFGVSGASPRTIVAVLSDSVVGANPYYHAVIYGGAAGGTGSLNAYAICTGAASSGNIGNHYWASGYNTTASGTFASKIVIASYDGATDKFRINGTEFTNTVALNTGTEFPITIGSRMFAPPSELGDFDAHEILFYSAALTTPQMEDLEAHLSAKWGLGL